eukprot:1433493-Rhodomonas_salina.1
MAYAMPGTCISQSVLCYVRYSHSVWSDSCLHASSAKPGTNNAYGATALLYNARYYHSACCYGFAMHSPVLRAGMLLPDAPIHRPLSGGARGNVRPVLSERMVQSDLHASQGRRLPEPGHVPYLPTHSDAMSGTDVGHVPISLRCSSTMLGMVTVCGTEIANGSRPLSPYDVKYNVRH